MKHSPANEGAAPIMRGGPPPRPTINQAYTFGRHLIQLLTYTITRRQRIEVQYGPSPPCATPPAAPPRCQGRWALILQRCDHVSNTTGVSNIKLLRGMELV